jgi:DegV family protein with EDD domain
MGISILTDAASNLFPSFLRDHGSLIKVLPMPMTFDGKQYLCYEDGIDAVSFSHEFYSKMREGCKVSTSLPSPGLLLETSEKEIERGNKVIFVSLSSHISGSYQSAMNIADELNSRSGQKAMVAIDSKTAGFGEGMVALFAENLAKSGYSFAECIEKSEQYVSKVRSEFSVDNLRYLAGTGRISKLNAVLGNALLVKPLLYGSPEGKICVSQKVIGRKNALKRLAAQASENIADKSSKVYLTHCDAYEEALEIKTMLCEKSINDVEIFPYDLITGAHVGPGTLAIFYLGKNRLIAKKTPF